MAEILQRKDGIYTIDKLNCLSVTHVLNLLDKPFLYRWYAKLGWDGAEKVKRESCAIGAHVDDYIIQHFTGGELQPFGLTEAELVAKKDRAIKNFHLMVDECKPKHVLSQQLVYWDKPEEETAGTLDAVVEVSGKFTKAKTNEPENVLVDWKVANQISDTYVIQIQTYLALLNYCIEKGILKTIKPIKELWIVRFDKEKEFKWSRDILRMDPDPKVFEVFMQLRRVHNGMKYIKELRKAK